MKKTLVVCLVLISFVVSAQSSFSIANNDLGFNILKSVKPEKNFIFSPLSLVTALNVISEGSMGKTKNEIEVLTGNIQKENRDSLKSYLKGFSKVCLLLDSVQVRMANACWVGSSINLNEHFNKKIKDDYDAALFVNGMQSSNDVQNWIQEHTKGHIIYTPDPVANNDIRILNTAYFSGRWLHKFDKSLTKDGVFNTGQGIEKTKFMHQVSSFNYFETKKFQCAGMAYTCPTYSMYIMLPKKKTPLKEIEENLSTAMFNKIFSKCKTKRLDLQLPKFSIATTYSANDELTKQGCGTMFSPKADFSGILANAPLHVEKVLQQSFIEIDEEKTVAASLTEITMLGSVRTKKELKPINFHANHPFLFLIIDNSTQTILFIGHFSSPVINKL